METCRSQDAAGPNTGDGFAADGGKLDYSALNERDRRLYDALLKPLLEMERFVIVRDIDFTGDEKNVEDIVFSVISALRYDNPAFFWMPEWQYIYVKATHTCQFRFDYPITAEEKEDAWKLIDAYTDWICRHYQTCDLFFVPIGS